MGTNTEVITVGEWTMHVHSIQATPDSRFTLVISNIRSGTQHLPDWKDADDSYKTHEDVVAAARKWAQRALK